jgi:hypothetical protein
MKDPAATVSETELAVLHVLWDLGQATVRQIDRRLYRRPTVATYATVLKLLERLEAKGCVRRDRSGFAHARQGGCRLRAARLRSAGARAEFAPTAGAGIAEGKPMGAYAEPLVANAFAATLLALLVGVATRLPLRPAVRHAGRLPICGGWQRRTAGSERGGASGAASHFPQQDGSDGAAPRPLVTWVADTV